MQQIFQRCRAMWTWLFVLALLAAAPASATVFDVPGDTNTVDTGIPCTVGSFSTSTLPSADPSLLIVSIDGSTENMVNVLNLGTPIGYHSVTVGSASHYRFWYTPPAPTSGASPTCRMDRTVVVLTCMPLSMPSASGKVTVYRGPEVVTSTIAAPAGIDPNAIPHSPECGIVSCAYDKPTAALITTWTSSASCGAQIPDTGCSEPLRKGPHTTGVAGLHWAYTHSVDSTHALDASAYRYRHYTTTAWFDVPTQYTVGDAAPAGATTTTSAFTQCTMYTGDHLSCVAFSPDDCILHIYSVSATHNRTWCSFIAGDGVGTCVYNLDTSAISREYSSVYPATTDPSNNFVGIRSYDGMIDVVIHGYVKHTYPGDRQVLVVNDHAVLYTSIECSTPSSGTMSCYASNTAYVTFGSGGDITDPPITGQLSPDVYDDIPYAFDLVTAVVELDASGVASLVFVHDQPGGWTTYGDCGVQRHPLGESGMAPSLGWVYGPGGDAQYVVRGAADVAMVPAVFSPAINTLFNPETPGMSFNGCHIVDIITNKLECIAFDANTCSWMSLVYDEGASTCANGIADDVPASSATCVYSDGIKQAVYGTYTYTDEVVNNRYTLRTATTHDVTGEDTTTFLVIATAVDYAVYRTSDYAHCNVISDSGVRLYNNPECSVGTQPDLDTHIDHSAVCTVTGVRLTTSEHTDIVQIHEAVVISTIDPPPYVDTLGRPLLFDGTGVHVYPTNYEDVLEDLTVNIEIDPEYYGISALPTEEFHAIPPPSDIRRKAASPHGRIVTVEEEDARVWWTYSGSDPNADVRYLFHSPSNTHYVAPAGFVPAVQSGPEQAFNWRQPGTAFSGCSAREIEDSSNGLGVAFECRSFNPEQCTWSNAIVRGFVSGTDQTPSIESDTTNNDGHGCIYSENTHHAVAGDTVHLTPDPEATTTALLTRIHTPGETAAMPGSVIRITITATSTEGAPLIVAVDSDRMPRYVSAAFTRIATGPYSDDLPTLLAGMGRPASANATSEAAIVFNMGCQVVDEDGMVNAVCETTGVVFRGLQPPPDESPSDDPAYVAVSVQGPTSLYSSSTAAVSLGMPFDAEGAIATAVYPGLPERRRDTTVDPLDLCGYVAALIQNETYYMSPAVIHSATCPGFVIVPGVTPVGTDPVLMWTPCTSDPDSTACYVARVGTTRYVLPDTYNPLINTEYDPADPAAAFNGCRIIYSSSTAGVVHCAAFDPDASPCSLDTLDIPITLEPLVPVRVATEWVGHPLETPCTHSTAVRPPGNTEACYYDTEVSPPAPVIPTLTPNTDCEGLIVTDVVPQSTEPPVLVTRSHDSTLHYYAVIGGAGYIIPAIFDPNVDTAFDPAHPEDAFSGCTLSFTDGDGSPESATQGMVHCAAFVPDDASCAVHTLTIRFYRESTEITVWLLAETDDPAITCTEVVVERPDGTTDACVYDEETAAPVFPDPLDPTTAFTMGPYDAYARPCMTDPDSGTIVHCVDLFVPLVHTADGTPITPSTPLVRVAFFVNFGNKTLYDKTTNESTMLLVLPDEETGVKAVRMGPHDAVLKHVPVHTDVVRTIAWARGLIGAVEPYAADVDIVSLDPRGSGWSCPVECPKTVANAHLKPFSNGWDTTLFGARNRKLSDECLLEIDELDRAREATADGTNVADPDDRCSASLPRALLAGHTSPRAIANDIVAFKETLGYPSVLIHAAGSGCEIGQAVADLLPDDAGKMIAMALDSPTDRNVSGLERAEATVEGRAAAVQYFAELCADDDKCAADICTYIEETTTNADPDTPFVCTGAAIHEAFEDALIGIEPPRRQMDPARIHPQWVRYVGTEWPRRVAYRWFDGEIQMAMTLDRKISRAQAEGALASPVFSHRTHRATALRALVSAVVDGDFSLLAQHAAFAGPSSTMLIRRAGDWIHRYSRVPFGKLNSGERIEQIVRHRGQALLNASLGASVANDLLIEAAFGAPRDPVYTELRQNMAKRTMPHEHSTYPVIISAPAYDTAGSSAIDAARIHEQYAARGAAFLHNVPDVGRVTTHKMRHEVGADTGAVGAWVGAFFALQTARLGTLDATEFENIMLFADSFAGTAPPLPGYIPAARRPSADGEVGDIISHTIGRILATPEYVHNAGYAVACPLGGLAYWVIDDTVNVSALSTHYIYLDGCEAVPGRAITGRVVHSTLYDADAGYSGYEFDSVYVDSSCLHVDGTGVPPPPPIRRNVREAPPPVQTACWAYVYNDVSGVDCDNVPCDTASYADPLPTLTEAATGVVPPTP